MHKLLADYKDFQLKRKHIKINTMQEIPVEVRYKNIVIMSKLTKFPPSNCGHEIMLVPTEEDQPTLIRLTGSSVIGGYNIVNDNKITITVRTLGNVMLIFPETLLRDRALTLMQALFSDESTASSDSRA